MTTDDIPGYALADETLPEAPISAEAFDHLEQSLMFTEEDEALLRQAGEVLEPQIDDILDLWYGFVGDHEFLVYYFSDAETGDPDGEYLDRVRERFGQWIRDTCNPPYDDAWLRYQFEIGRRHHLAGKNETDDATAVPHIHVRYLVSFIYPITATIREYLANDGHDDETVDAMYHAWFKTVVLQVALWTYPYVPEGDW